MELIWIPAFVHLLILAFEMKVISEISFRFRDIPWMERWVGKKSLQDSASMHCTESFQYLTGFRVREAMCIAGRWDAPVIDFPSSSWLLLIFGFVSHTTLFSLRFSSIFHFLCPSPLHFDPWVWCAVFTSLLVEVPIPFFFQCKFCVLMMIYILRVGLHRILRDHLLSRITAWRFRSIDSAPLPRYS
jgi:hypothetical protein